MKTAQQGFTLIELVMVVVLLGILAAAAIPKVVDLQTEARIATVKKFAGAVATGAMLARSKVIISSLDVSNANLHADLDGDGQKEHLIYGYPNGGHPPTMKWIVQDMGDFKYASGEYRLNNSTTCKVTYTNPGGPDEDPTIKAVTTNCSN